MAAGPRSRSTTLSPSTPRRLVWPRRLSDGTPLLLDKQIGEGHILLFTSGLENLTNDLPLHPVFVAFVDRAARYLSGSERLSGSRMVDSYAQLRSAAGPATTSAADSVEVIGPDGHRLLSLSEARTAQSFRLARAGFYQIHFANGRDAVTRRQSRPARVGLSADARPTFRQLWSGSSAGSRANPAMASAPSESKYRPVSLWWCVMLLAFLVAMAETALSSGYMGTQREEI